ncbi:MAG: Ribosomal RNA small subunit methyltransferase G [bacterium ADurb.Bin429]|nr:MAG: Ribosomal RNA small subunit methyltransferase G [bacterium ADurb.Bin429]
MLIKHFLDSLTVELAWTPAPGERAVDIGAGAGFPGLPLAIRHPEVRVTLNDSVRKKVTFIEEAIAALGLDNAEAAWARAEELGQRPAFRGQFDIALARAVAHLGALVEYALPLLREGGRLIAMKGPNSLPEISDSARALALLGGEVAETQRLALPTGDERVLIIVRKVRPTPAKFPRDPGAAKKHPLFLDTSRTTRLE